MLAGVSYEASHAVFGRRDGTTRSQVIAALRKLGMSTPDYFKPLGPEPVETLTTPALLITNKRRKHWHWTVYCPEARRILDPAQHVPSLPEYRVSAFLPVTRRELA
jgi:hypothetical protein